MRITINKASITLTKKVIAQMPVCYSIEVLKQASVLGYVLNCHTDMPKCFILEHDGKYYRLAGNWKKSVTSFYRKLPKGWSQDWRFESCDLCNMAWEAYEKIVASAVHFYI